MCRTTRLGSLTHTNTLGILFHPPTPTKSLWATPACNSSVESFHAITLNWILIMKINRQTIKRERGPIIVILILISIFYFREDIRLILHCKQVHDFNLDHHTNLRRVQ